ncbi:chaplin [Streptomyces sp. NPDC001595]|uniref:chaplin n=1 Tax=Streptomyces sp. NPDC001532 TaxID=3154520 RepID=UPI00331D37C4
MRITARIAATAVTAVAALALAGTATTATATEADCEDGACAVGVAAGSPGFLSGNVVQIPVDLDANVCGNSVNLIGLLNPASDNNCGD